MGVDTNTLHYERHCSHRLFSLWIVSTIESWRAFLYCVFSQELRLAALPSLPKAAGSDLTAGPNVVGFGCQAWLKTLPKRINNVRQQDTIVSQHFKRELGLAAKLDPRILSLVGQLDPISLDLIA